MKTQQNLCIIAPSIFPNCTINEAEILGGFIWLWNQEQYYRKSAIDSALETILAIMHSKNYAFILLDNRPIGYFNWAYFDQETKLNYLKNEENYISFLKHTKYSSNKETWILSWFCPTGRKNNFLMRNIAKNIIFKSKTVFFSYHKPHSKPSTRYFKVL